jgi:hypothetical protein
VAGNFGTARMTGTGACCFCLPDCRNGGAPAGHHPIRALSVKDVNESPAHRVALEALIKTIANAIGASPSGKAAGFDPAMRWFESSRPCHFFLAMRERAANE